VDESRFSPYFGKMKTVWDDDLLDVDFPSLQALIARHKAMEAADKVLRISMLITSL